MTIPTPDNTTSDRSTEAEKLTPEELRDFMNLQGISVRELSEILGVTSQAITLWTSGSRSISVTVSRLIRLFKKYPKLLREF